MAALVLNTLHANRYPSDGAKPKLAAVFKTDTPNVFCI